MFQHPIATLALVRAVQEERIAQARAAHRAAWARRRRRSKEVEAPPTPGAATTACPSAGAEAPGYRRAS